MLLYIFSVVALQTMLSRIDDIVIAISAILITLLWIPIALNFFSADENKQYMARQRLKNASIGTVIYIMAISGTIFVLFNYIVTGKP